MNYNQSRANRSSTLSMNGTRGEQNELSPGRSTAAMIAIAMGMKGQQRLWRQRPAKHPFWGAARGLRSGKRLSSGGARLLRNRGVAFRWRDVRPLRQRHVCINSRRWRTGRRRTERSGAVIDRFGYAILPSLSPYRRNNVSLDTRQMRSDAELTGEVNRWFPMLARSHG